MAGLCCRSQEGNRAVVIVEIILAAWVGLNVTGLAALLVRYQLKCHPGSAALDRYQRSSAPERVTAAPPVAAGD